MICERKSFVSFEEALEWANLKAPGLKAYKCLKCAFFHLEPRMSDAQ